jgi:hypothetical protein
VIHFIVPTADEWGIRDYLNLYAPALAPRVNVLHYEDLPERTSATSGTYVFSALDQLSVGGRRLAAELADQLEQPGAGCRVINHPARTLLRLELLETLYREGLNQHRAARANGDLSTLRFPVFLREEFRHSGTLTPLLQTRAELDRALGREVLRGFRLPELLVVEFCETADAEGRYCKYAAFKIGSEIFADGWERGREWMLKAEQSEQSEARLLEERVYVLGNPHEQSLRRIFELAGVEYGRIDYAIKDGRVETWEINLNPTIRRGRRPDFRPLPEALDRIKDVARQHFLDRFEAALGGLDPGGPPVQLRLAYGEGCREEAKPMIRPGGPRGWLVPVAGMFRPIVPFLGRMSRAFTPLVARAARRRRRESR